MRGNDVVFGGEGDDVIDAGNGKDTVFGGDGHDQILGGRSQDKLFGGTGNDEIFGGSGKDLLVGAVGVANGVTTEIDTLTGGSSKDAFVVGAWGAYTAGGDADYADITDLGRKDTLWLASDNALMANDAQALTEEDMASVSKRSNFLVIEGRDIQVLSDLSNGLYSLGAAPTGDDSAGVYLNREGVAPELVAVLRGVSAPTPVEPVVEEATI